MSITIKNGKGSTFMLLSLWSIQENQFHMRNSILVFAASVLIIGTFVFTCNTSSQKIEDAQNKVKDANRELDEANKEYLAEIEIYRKEAADKIAANKRSIVEFHLRIENEKQDAKTEYQKKIATLEQKTSDLKRKLDEYKAEGKEQWKVFKIEFNHDLQELGKACKDLTAKRAL